MPIHKEQEHRRQRVLPIDRETLDMLQEYIERGGPVMRDGKRLIFSINRHRAWQIVKECAERAGLPKLVNPETGKVHNVSPHKLRDSFAVLAENKTTQVMASGSCRNTWGIRVSTPRPSTEK